MPGPRRAFRIAAPVCIAGLALFTGCDAARQPLLGGVPDLERVGPPDAASAAGVDMPCPAGRPWLATVEQRDFDARLELADAAGGSLARIAGAARGHGLELLYRDGRDALPLRLRIVAETPPPRGAGFRLRVYCLAQDPPKVAKQALSAQVEAADSRRATDQARRDAAAAAWRDAADAWTQFGETRLAAEAALQLAAVHYYEREDWSPALAAARRVLASPAAAELPSLRAAARLLEGAAAMELARGGRPPGDATSRQLPDPWLEARDALADAKSGFASAGEPVSAAQVEVYLASLYYDRGDFEAAIAGFESAAAALRAAGATADEGRVARNLAAVRFDRGDYAGAAVAFASLLRGLPPTATPERATTLQNLAAAHATIGDRELALAAYRESLEIGQKLGNEDLVARALVGLGMNHSLLGHADLALTYLREAVAVRRRQDRPEALAHALAALGDALRRRGQPALAGAAHREAVAALGPDAAPLLRARMQLALGANQADAGDSAGAVATISAALVPLEAQSHRLVAQALLSRARAHRQLGALGPAAADAARAATLARTGVDPETLIAAEVEAARISLDRRDRAAARRAVDSAVARIGRLPVGAANPENRLTLRARLRPAYDLRVDLIADDARREAAAGAASRARDQALEALRAVADIDLDGPLAASSRGIGGPRDEEALFEKLAARRHRLDALAERGTPATPTMRALEQEIAVLRTRLATGEFADAGALGVAPAADTVATHTAGSVAATSTRATAATRALRTPSTPMAGTAVIVYSLGESRGWRWTITSTGVELDPLPPRSVVESAVARVLRGIRDRDAAPMEREFDTLARLLLPAPRVLAQVRRWRVVADGPVGAAPWSLLAQRAAVESVSLLPSAAVLFASGNPPEARPRQVGHPLRLALFGDPVFGTDDPRFAQSATARRDAPGTAGTDTRLEMEPRALPRLPGTAREVETLVRLAGDSAPVRATGFQATRDAVLRLPPGRFDVLHLATHAIIDPQVPELASLVLSRVDAGGAPRPGSLRARDILRDGAAPPLVVLSACDSAAEPAATADGRMTLVRAFLGAGAREVVASLWEVPDASTTELMAAFYEGLLREGLDAETALKRAQSRLAAGGRWRAPYFWAGFVLTRAAP